MADDISRSTFLIAMFVMFSNMRIAIASSGFFVDTTAADAGATGDAAATGAGAPTPTGAAGIGGGAGAFSLSTMRSSTWSVARETDDES